MTVSYWCWELNVTRWCVHITGYFTLSKHTNNLNSQARLFICSYWNKKTKCKVQTHRAFTAQTRLSSYSCSDITEWTHLKSISHIYLSPCTEQYNKAKLVSKRGNGLPQKPTAHQAGLPYNSFITIKHDNKETRQTEKVKVQRLYTNMDRSQV